MNKTDGISYNKVEEEEEEEEEEDTELPTYYVQHNDIVTTCHSSLLVSSGASGTRMTDHFYTKNEGQPLHGR